MTEVLVFLGTGAGSGVPAFYCDCAACREARREPRFRRSRCAVLLRGSENILIDTPPELRSQLVREGAADIDRVILTHSHFDHFGGFGDLEFYIRLRRQGLLPAAMSIETYRDLAQSYGYMVDCLQIEVVGPGMTWAFDETVCTFLAAQHAPGTLGVLLERSGRRTAYFPDTGPLPAETRERLQGIDCLIIDATFWGRNWMPEQHQSVDSAIQLSRELDVKSTILTHVAMHHDQPVTGQELEGYLENSGSDLQAAYDGLTIPL
jgi:phosphoribosyl 1,2-cyclic phosphate phosphodiesterase